MGVSGAALRGPRVAKPYSLAFHQVERVHLCSAVAVATDHLHIAQQSSVGVAVGELLLRV